jgi:hypothetical protein
MLPGVGHVLQLRISVTNIGSAKMDPIQNKTGVAISFPAAIQTSAPHMRTDKWWPDIPGGARGSGGSGGLLFGPGGDGGDAGSGEAATRDARRRRCPLHLGPQAAST